MLDKIFSIRLTPTLHQQIDEAARRAGQTPSGFVRAIVAERVQLLGQDALQGGQDAHQRAQGERAGVQYD